MLPRDTTPPKLGLADGFPITAQLILGCPCQMTGELHKHCVPRTAQHREGLRSVSVTGAYHLDVGVGVVVMQGGQGEQEGPHGWLRVSPAAHQQAHLNAPLVGSPPQPVVDGRPEPWEEVQGTKGGSSTSLTLSLHQLLRAPKP